MKKTLEGIYPSELMAKSMKQQVDHTQRQIEQIEASCIFDHEIEPIYLKAMKQAIDDHTERIEQVEQLISELDDELNRNILTMRYFQNMKITEIVDKTFYGESKIYQSLSQSIKDLSRLQQ